MSYSIESDKLCLTIPLPENDTRFGAAVNSPDLVLFCNNCACSSIHPRHFSWASVDLARVGTWDGRWVLPESIWAAARACDEGSIKPAGRNRSGTSYLRQWSTAIENREAFTNSSPVTVVTFALRDQHSEYEHRLDYPTSFEAVDELDTSMRCGRYNWGQFGHLTATLKASFKHLSDQAKFGREKRFNIRIGVDPVTGIADENLLCALHLYLNRKHLPFRMGFME